jgi:hypothetical protein
MPISFDYDGTLSTKKGKDLAAKFISEGKDVRILTARDSNGDNTDLESTAKDLGIEKIYYSNGRDKWSFVLKYGIKERFATWRCGKKAHPNYRIITSV